MNSSTNAAPAKIGFWNLMKQIQAMMLIPVILTALAMGGYGAYSTVNQIHDAVERRFALLDYDRALAMEQYLGTIQADLRNLASLPFTSDALSAFENGWQAMGENQTATLQDVYITKNPNPIGQKEKLDAGDDG